MTNASRRPHRLARPAVIAAAVLSSIATVGVLGLADTAAAATVTCHRWASSTGSDARDGTTQAKAFASLGTLAAALRPGETGCIPAGDRFVAHGQGVVAGVNATAAQPITIRSGPGGRATIVGGVLLNERAHDLVFADLDVVGDGFTGNALHVNGRSITLSGLTVRHPTGICIGVGTIGEFEQTYQGAEATDVTITNSRIEGCGTDPSMQPRWAQDQFSGSHGIYIVNARRTRIVENVIVGNKYRGIQTYPNATDTLIENNVLHANATQVNIGSSLTEGYPWRSRGTVVRGNVMSARVTNFRPDKNSAQVHGYFPAGTPAEGNRVEGNCWVDEAGPEVTGNAIEVGANTFGVAQYVDAARGDFRQTATSPCRNFGPTSLRPQAPARTAPAVSCATGRAVLELATTVRTPSAAPQWAYTRIWHRVDGGQWQYADWYAAWANDGAAQSWWYQAPGAAWAKIGDRVTLAPQRGLVEVWEQRYELVDGAWQFAWHDAGRCTI